MNKKDKKTKKEVNGKLEQPNLFLNNEVLSPDEFRQRLFGTSSNKYKTSNVAEYIDRLNTMNITDLQRECLRCDLAPHENRARMVDNLTKAFNTHFKDMKVASMKPKPAPNIDKDLLAQLRRMGS